MATHLHAFRNRDRSFSHWGLFTVPEESVTILMEDCGLIGDELVSVFTLNNELVESRVPHDFDIQTYIGAKKMTEIRTDADIACICSAWAIDPASIKVVF